MIRAATLTLLLTAVYGVALQSTKPADLLIGAAVALGALTVAGQLRAASGKPSFAGRLLWLFPWLAVVVREVALGTWQLARLSLRPASAPPTGIVGIPIGSRSTQGAAVSALIATISPGEVLIDFDWDEGFFYLHVLDATDPDQVRERHQRIYDRFQSRVFP